MNSLSKRIVPGILVVGAIAAGGGGVRADDPVDWKQQLEQLPQEKEIAVPATGEIHVDFVLGITGLPQY